MNDGHDGGGLEKHQLPSCILLMGFDTFWEFALAYGRAFSVYGSRGLLAIEDGQWVRSATENTNHWVGSTVVHMSPVNSSIPFHVS